VQKRKRSHKEESGEAIWSRVTLLRKISKVGSMSGGGEGLPYDSNLVTGLGKKGTSPTTDKTLGVATG